MASYVAHDPEVSLPFGPSSTGKIWSWLILAVFIHVISGQQFGSLAGLPGLWWVRLGHSGDWDPHDAGVGSLTHSQGSKSKSKNTQSLRFWTSITALKGRLEASSEWRKRPCLLMEGAAVSSCQGTGARRESVASVPVYHAGFGIWGSACLDSAHSLYTGTSREMSQILLKM